jgi:hypothetical protein
MADSYVNDMDPWIHPVKPGHYGDIVEPHGKSIIPYTRSAK